ncbi:nitrate reductase [Endozoicomonas sp. OPT23]|uniref:nitrate reductase n=1 Tax=Endozoicomonas sp. OPT23 TaxID=2072845 RepID=UPI00129A2E6D|nr:nitrate reductase [Endozoicomonas sp. OPT23]MRI34651.1 nitrate reductase [Endozoicomonas sp. OPT23]
MSDIKIIKTTCAYCGVGCGIKASVLDEQQHLIEVSGDTEHPANFGRLCSKGSALAETISLENRLLSPSINGREVAWSDALDDVAGRLKETLAKYGPESVAFYGSGQLLTEDYYVANKLMKGFIGSANMDTNSRLCMASTVAGQKRAFGADAVSGNYQDLELADLLVLIGSNTAWCHPVLFQRIRAEKEKRPELKIVVIDPRRTETCDIADLHLAIRPDADIELFNGLFNYLVDRSFLDSDFIETSTSGIDQLQGSNTDLLSVAEIADYCRLDKKDLEQFYQWFADNDKTVTSWSQGVNQSTSGTDKVNAIINCHLLTGRIGKPGATPLSLTGQPNAMGGREVGGLANQLAAHMDFSDPADIDRVARFWNTDNIAEKPGLTAVDLFQAMADGRIKFVWIMATNPAASLTDTDKVREALAKCPNVIVSDCVQETDTSAFAHVKLPAAGWSEKEGTVTNSERRISRQRALLPLSGQTKPDWWIISEVAKRLGFENAFNYQKPADIFREHAALSGFENNLQGKKRAFNISALAEITEQEYDEMLPVQWPLVADNKSKNDRLFVDGVFFTPDGKAQFIMPQKKLFQNNNKGEESLYPLTLNTGRVRDHWHTMTRTGLTERLGQHIEEPYVTVHPETAKVYGLSKDGFARVKTAAGHSTFKVHISDAMAMNELFIPIHWTRTHSRTGLAGCLMTSETDPFSRQPGFKNIRAAIESVNFSHKAVLISREKVKLTSFSYATEVKQEGCYRYELAGYSELTKQCLGVLEGKDREEGKAQPLTYSNPLSDSLTAAVYSNGQIDAFVIVGELSLPVDRNWLRGKFAVRSESAVPEWQLLAGVSSSGDSSDKTVCSCMGVGEKTICQAIEEHALVSAIEVGKVTRAGTNCGSCIPEINQLIASANPLQKAS